MNIELLIAPILIVLGLVGILIKQDRSKHRYKNEMEKWRKAYETKDKLSNIKRDSDLDAATDRLRNRDSK